MKRESRAPLIVAIVLLLLPVLYVGSYLALVRPYCVVTGYEQTGRYMNVDAIHYRWGGERAAAVFWPLEQIDRKMRPGAWEPVIPFIHAESPMRFRVYNPPND